MDSTAITSDVLQDNPLSNLMFSDDSDNAYTGIQDGNTFHVTGITGLDATPEFVFTNIPEQLAGEMVSYYFEGSSDLGAYDMEVKYNRNPVKIIDYRNIRDRGSNWGIYDQKLPTKHINELEQGKAYNIHLEWKGFSANYYVIFDVDPSDIQF